MKKYFFILFLLVIVCLGAVFWNEDKGNGGLLVQTQALVRSWNENRNTGSQVAKEERKSLQLVSEGPSEEFKYWVRSESLEIEKSSVDPLKKETALRETAKKLRSEEARYLKDLVLSAQSSAKQKIFSVYLLSLSVENFQPLLSEIIQAPLSFSGSHVVHSPEEALAMQEKALRRMALEAFFEKSKKDPQFRSVFKSQVRQINDDELRKFADEKLRQME